MNIDEAMQVAIVTDEIARYGRHFFAAIIGGFIGHRFGGWGGKRAYVAYSRRNRRKAHA